MKVKSVPAVSTELRCGRDTRQGQHKLPARIKNRIQNHSERFCAK